MSEKNNQEIINHSTAHVMMQALVNLYGAIPGVGPAIENGFYHDFEAEHQVTLEDLPTIEAEMKKIIKADLPIKRSMMPIDEAIEFLKSKNYNYTAELAEELKSAGETEVSFYEQGDFINMCKGPHLESTKKIGAFKLLSLAGAYWRGDEKNKMLQRIYGIAYETKEELEAYLKMREEAEKRDHKKLGKELNLFMMHDYAPGIPFFLPNGMQVLIELTKFAREYSYGEGYREIKTPQLFNAELWKTSGHWDHYQEDMFLIHHAEDNSDIGIKPMNCPGHMLVFKRDLYSYRDLPLRLAETTTLYRNEKSGTLSGLTRVRALSQDDTHIFLAEGQIFDEIVIILEKIKKIYEIFNLQIDVINLSTRPAEFLGEKETWDRAEEGLKKALEQSELDYVVDDGGGAFYGPKIDIKVKDAIGRQWQLATIQLDYQMPQRFGLEYTDADGSKKTPVVIHRALLGSMERFMGILIEHYTGAFPTWLSPVQAVIIPVSEKFTDYGQTIKEKMLAENIRVEIDDSAESLGKRIRNAEKKKMPYILVVGEKEIEAKAVAIRKRSEGDLGSKPAEEFIEEILKEIKDRK